MIWFKFPPLIEKVGKHFQYQNYNDINQLIGNHNMRIMRCNLQKSTDYTYSYSKRQKIINNSINERETPTISTATQVNTIKEDQTATTFEKRRFVIFRNQDRLIKRYNFFFFSPLFLMAGKDTQRKVQAGMTCKRTGGEYLLFYLIYGNTKCCYLWLHVENTKF